MLFSLVCFIEPHRNDGGGRQKQYPFLCPQAEKRSLKGRVPYPPTEFRVQGQRPRCTNLSIWQKNND